MAPTAGREEIAGAHPAVRIVGGQHALVRGVRLGRARVSSVALLAPNVGPTVRRRSPVREAVPERHRQHRRFVAADAVVDRFTPCRGPQGHYDRRKDEASEHGPHAVGSVSHVRGDPARCALTPARRVSYVAPRWSRRARRAGARRLVCDGSCSCSPSHTRCSPALPPTIRRPTIACRVIARAMKTDAGRAVTAIGPTPFRASVARRARLHGVPHRRIVASSRRTPRPGRLECVRQLPRRRGGRVSHERARPAARPGGHRGSLVWKLSR